MATDNPIQILTHEHKYILKVVHALSVIDADLEQGKTIEVGLFRKVVLFMRNFADKCHHAKEEAVLFPAMESKGVPKTGCPLAALRAEHTKGRELVAALEKAADAYASADPDAPANLRQAIGGILQLYPNHIWKEDEMVFPMAERLFSPDELIKMKAAFDKAEAELGQDHDEYIAFANEMELLLGRERS